MENANTASRNNAAPQRLYLFQVATGTIPVTDPPLEMSAGCYLVQTGDGKNILIDTGLPRDFAPADMPPLEHGKSVIEHLAALGLAPDDIDTVICTHFDIDHVGFHPAFSGAEFVVQRTHFDAAHSGNPRFERTRPYWGDSALRYRLLDGDTELLPGLRLIETSGHALGHQSVLVDLPETGPILLAIDAVSLQRLYSPERTAWPVDDNEDQLRASTQKLLDLADRENVALVVFSHDGEQWRTLKQAPDWYA